MSREFISNESISNGSMSNGSISNGSMSNESISNESISNGSMSKESISKESISKESIGKESMGKEFVNEVPMGEALYCRAVQKNTIVNMEEFEVLCMAAHVKKYYGLWEPPKELSEQDYKELLFKMVRKNLLVLEDDRLILTEEFKKVMKPVADCEVLLRLVPMKDTFATKCGYLAGDATILKNMVTQKRSIYMSQMSREAFLDEFLDEELFPESVMEEEEQMLEANIDPPVESFPSIEELKKNEKILAVIDRIDPKNGTVQKRVLLQESPLSRELYYQGEVQQNRIYSRAGLKQYIIQMLGG